MKDFYITTSIMYTNEGPHIGFASELLQADIIARYQRIFNKRKVFYLTGSDDHGTKIAKTAENNNMDYKDFVDKNANLIKDLIKKLKISNSDFIQTSDKKRHYPTVVKVWNKLLENNDLYKKKYKGYYCVGCESFITKKDLKNGKCLFHDKPLEEVEEENYFFRLSKYTPQIKKAIENEKVIISKKYKKENLQFIESLNDISFSRSKTKVKWGIPVPNDEEQLIYVWGDALTNYLSAIGYAENEENIHQFWPADIHCIGKDILKFHSVIWLGILLALKLPLPKKIFVHGFILDADGRKMSKSLGNTINPFSLVEQYGADAFRYLLLKEIHPTQDSNFSIEKINETYNADLVKGLGNLISRVLTIIEKNNFIFEKAKMSNEIQKNITENFLNFKKNIENFEFNQAIQKITLMVNFANQYIDNNKPWEKTKDQKQLLYNLLIIFVNTAKMLIIVMPQIAEKILERIDVKLEKLDFSEPQLNFDFSNCKIKKGENLFNKN